MKSKICFSLFLFSLALIVTSCKKDALTPTEILTAKSWKVSSVKINGVEAITTFFNECDMDDFLTFTADGKYTLNINVNICYEGQTNDTGTWSFSPDGKSFIFDGEIWVAEITEAQLKFTFTMDTDSMIMTLIPK